MKRSELKSLIKEVIEESKEYSMNITVYNTSVSQITPAYNVTIKGDDLLIIKPTGGYRYETSGVTYNDFITDISNSGGLIRDKYLDSNTVELWVNNKGEAAIEYIMDNDQSLITESIDLDTTDDIGYFYIVMKPKVTYEPEDMLLQTNIENIILQSKGGLSYNEIHLITQNFDQAFTVAYDLLQEYTSEDDYEDFENRWKSLDKKIR